MSDTRNAGQKALDYAEQKLKVHAIYENAKLARQSLENVQAEILNLRSEKRSKEHSKATLEMELMERERAKDPSESVAAFERRFKVVLHNDGDIQGIVNDLFILASEIESLEYHSDILIKDIQIAVARMNELGGYFQYLAAVKQASAANTNSQIRDGNPWQ